MIVIGLIISSIMIGFSSRDGGSSVGEDEGPEIEPVLTVETCQPRYHGEITIFKFHDLNGNGIYEPDQGEYGLEGWDFEIYQKGKRQQEPGTSPWVKIGEGTTNETGYLVFIDCDNMFVEDLEPEREDKDFHFKVEETLKDGWYFTGGTSIEGGTNEGEEIDDLDETFFVDDDEDVTMHFGNAQYCSITAYKEDEDGTRLDGWTINLWNTTEDGEKHTIVNTEETDSDGKVIFDELKVGDYVVEEIVEDGWENVTSTSFDVTLKSGEHEEVLFINKEIDETGDITVYKFYDKEMDGIYDPDVDELLDGWTIHLMDSDENWIDSNETDENGMAVFRGLDPGLYFVEEELKEGWFNTTSDYFSVEVKTDMNKEVYFGNSEYGNITAFKFYDVKGTGEYNPEDGDELLDGWMIHLMDSKGNWIESNETDENGMVLFQSLKPDVYIVEEELKDGWFNTTATNFTVEVKPGETTEVSFRNSEYGYITVYKFYDKDMDGIYDSDVDELLDGWTIHLMDSEENWIESNETDENGKVLFQSLKPGVYVVEEELKDGWFNTTATNFTVEVKAGENTDIYFGNSQYGRIIITKFHDLNMNGKWETGEPLVDGVYFTVSEELSGTTGEEIEGRISFRNLIPGQYTVVEELPEGWFNTTKKVVDVEVLPGVQHNIVFGNVRYGNITVCKFNDTNMNGNYDDEEMLPGWEFKLWNVTDGQLDTVLDKNETGPCGCYTFENLLPGHYAVEEIPQDGWINTTDMIQYIDLSPGDSPKVWFGNAMIEEEDAQITIYKFYDTNMDGIYDPGAGDYLLDEMGVDFNVFGDLDSGVEVDFDIEVFGILSDTYEPGYYRITEEVPVGWIATTETMQEYDLGPGDHWEVYFGNIEYGALEVYKFYDWNMNGTWDCGEEMLAGWEFNLWNTTEDEDLGESIRTGTTDENGYILFDNLEPGYYAVQEVLREDDCWYLTTDEIQFIEVNPGEPVDLWFGNVRGGNITGYKFCDWNMNGVWDDEEPALEGWTIHLYREGETEPSMTTETDENGYYAFTCLEPGYYIVEEELKEGWYNTTSTYYEVELGPEDEINRNFGNHPFLNITGIKFYDFTMNGTFEPKNGDMPLQGREVALWKADEDGNKLGIWAMRNTFTDNHGYYTFEYLEPGHYIVEQVKPCCDWIHTTDREVHVELRCKDVVVNFGEYKMTSIDVYVECNTMGVVVTIYESDEYGVKGDQVDTGFTGDNGWYISIKLEPGYYLVELEDGQYEHVQLRMGEQVTFETPEENVNTSQVVVTVAKYKTFN